MEFARRIYGLYATGDRALRYIGQTENLQKRYVTHTANRAVEGMSVKRLWVERCLADGKAIRIRTLEIVRSDGQRACKTLAYRREAWWIKRVTLRGIRLLNGQRWFVDAAPKSVCDAWDFLNRSLIFDTPEEAREANCWREWQIIRQIEKDFPNLAIMNYRYKKMYQMPTCM